MIRTRMTYVNPRPARPRESRSLPIYIAHAYAHDPVGSAACVRAICRRLVVEGHLPIAPQLYLPAFLDETTERNLALQFCLRLVALADEVRVYGEPTAGMRLEIDEARRLEIPVLDGETGKAWSAKRKPPRRGTRAAVEQ